MTVDPSMFDVLLLGYLHRHCRGLARARTQGRIAQDFRGRLGIAATDRDVRDALARLALAGWPCGTARQGAFICVDPLDWRTAYRNLYGRLREQARRCRRFRRTFIEAAGGQQRFDFTEAEERYHDLATAPLFMEARL